MAGKRHSRELLERDVGGGWSLHWFKTGINEMPDATGDSSVDKAGRILGIALPLSDRDPDGLSPRRKELVDNDGRRALVN